jgi:hypothetical protein
MAAKPKSTKIKQQAHRLIDELPDDCTVEDIHYRLYLVDKIGRSEQSPHRLGGIPHADIKKRFAKWVTR